MSADSVGEMLARSNTASLNLPAESDSGLISVAIPLTVNNRNLIISLAARHRLPAIYPFRFFAPDGGLISYGPDFD